VRIARYPATVSRDKASSRELFRDENNLNYLRLRGLPTTALATLMLRTLPVWCHENSLFPLLTEGRGASLGYRDIDMSRPSDRMQGTLDMLMLKIVALEPMNGFAVSQLLKQVSGDVLQVSDGSPVPGPA
jgi:hypothetical protein